MLAAGFFSCQNYITILNILNEYRIKYANPFQSVSLETECVVCEVQILFKQRLVCIDFIENPRNDC